MSNPFCAKSAPALPGEAPDPRSFAVVRMTRLLGVLAALEIERARRRRELAVRDLAFIAEAAIRGRKHGWIAARLPGRDRPTIDQAVHTMRERGLLWLPAALRRSR